MPAYLVYICEGVSDRNELETYWKDIPWTFLGFDIKLHTTYRSNKAEVLRLVDV